ncbi:hypothetical protein ABIA45_007443 [Bradyrhizobium sp. USDA 336]
MDNVFIERLWRSLKHEDIYLKGYADGREAKAGIASWIAFYNDRRLHQAHGYRTPMAVRRERMQAAEAVVMVDNADALTTCPSVDAPGDARRIFRQALRCSRGADICPASIATVKCRRPVWEFADQVQITAACSGSTWACPGFPDPVSRLLRHTFRLTFLHLDDL